MSFSEKLKQLRESRNLTQNALAKCIGISRSAIAMYESGVREPDFHTEEALADFFSISLDDLREWKESSHIEAIGLTTREIFKRNLNVYIKRSGKNTKMISQEMGIPYTTLIEWVNGNNFPRANGIEMLSRYFRIPKSYLLEEALENSQPPLSPHEEDVLTAYREMIVSSTAERLAQIMDETGMKQVDILNIVKPYCDFYHIKLGKSDLSQFVSGKVKPGQSKLTILSLALNVSEAWLMGFDCDRERSRDGLSFNPLLAFSLSPHEEDVLTAYREQPDKQPIVDSVLGVTNVIHLAVAADGGGVEAGKSPDDPDGSQKNGSRGSTDGF